MIHTVLIVEDQSMTRQLFEILIAASERYSVIGSIDSAEQALAFCRLKKVDLILMDVMTELGSSGLAAAEEIKKVFPEIKIIIVTSMPEFSWIERAKQVGVDSFWYKNSSKEDIIPVMDATMAGKRIYPDDTPKVTIGSIDNHMFSQRELEVLRELLTGESNSEIGEKLGIAPATVKRHVENMLSKTGFRTRTELAVEARRLGIVINNI